MTQEDKELLLKDLCARVYYRVKFNHEDKHTLCKILYIIPIYDYFNVIYYDNAINEPKKTSIDNVKPYLFPLSSMTWEQECQYREVIASSLNHYEVYDWFNKNHFDYRGLIEKGLAIDATGLNIY